MPIYNPSAGAGGIPTQITVADEAADTSCYILFATAPTGDLGPKTNTKLGFNSSTGTVSLTGNIDLADTYEYQINGARALSFTGGTGNTWIGPDTGAAILAGGTYNFAAGSGAGNALTNGDFNFFAGFEAGHLATTCSGTIAIGSSAGFNNNGSSNLFIGRAAGYNNTSGIGIVAMGAYACYSNVTNDYLIGIGENSLYSCNGGFENLAVGSNAGKNITTGIYNILLGSNAGFGITTQSSNICIGRYVMNGMAGIGNIGMGQAALDGAGSSGNYNVVIGNSAATGTFVSSYNVLMGYQAGFSIGTSSGYNLMLGAYAGAYAVTSTGCVFLGANSGYYETGNNKLFIDNATRASEADGRVKALIYGVFAAAVANQYLTINGNLLLGQIKAGATQAAAGAAATELWKTASHATLPDNVLMIGA